MRVTVSVALASWVGDEEVAVRSGPKGGTDDVLALSKSQTGRRKRNKRGKKRQRAWENIGSRIPVTFLCVGRSEW